MRHTPLVNVQSFSRQETTRGVHRSTFFHKMMVRMACRCRQKLDRMDRTSLSGPSDHARNFLIGWLLCGGRGACVEIDEAAPGKEYWWDETAGARIMRRHGLLFSAPRVLERLVTWHF